MNRSRVRATIVLTLAGILIAAWSALAQAAEVPGVAIEKIWDQGRHNAFTDLTRFRGNFYCTFREGSGHVPGAHGTDGTVRVIASDDGSRWESVALLEDEGVDLRDPKLSITPDGRLMVVMGGSYYDGTRLLKRHPRVAFSKPNGTGFGDPLPVRIDPRVSNDRDWLWRVTWHEGKAYGVVYQYSSGNAEWGLHLVRSDDGVEYEWMHTFELTGRPNESTVRFMPDGEMIIVVRREGGNTHGQVGHSRPTYREWTWNELPMRLGGPNFCRLPDGTLILGTRNYQPKVTTVLGRLTKHGGFTRLLEFPSAGDTSYPGLLVHKDELWVSYYSSHEGRTSIYLAKIPLSVLSPR
jgi:hypothetical protein